MVSGPPPATTPFLPAAPALPAGVVDIDIEEDGVNEYGEDIFVYMKEKEAEVVVGEDYLEQSPITPEQRAVLVDWLIQVGWPSLAPFWPLLAFPRLSWPLLAYSGSSLLLSHPLHPGAALPQADAGVALPGHLPAGQGPRPA